MITRPERPPSEDALTTKQQLGERWACSTKTIERQIAQGVLRPIRIGRLVRFRLEDVLAAEEDETLIVSSCLLVSFKSNCS